MMIKEYTVIEPHGSPLKFISQSCLESHVIKHVITHPDERWQNIFDPEQVRKLQYMYDEGIPFQNSSEFKDIVSQYSQLASDTLSRCCTEVKNHVHFWEDTVTIYSNHRVTIDSKQKIIAYSVKESVVVIATLNMPSGSLEQNASSQSKGKEKQLEDYVIVTMYRPEKKVLKKHSFTSLVNDKIERQNPIRPYEIILADHR